MFAEFDSRGEIIAVRILKGAENAALLHKLVNLAQNFFARFVWNRDERQAANNITDFAEL